MIRLALVHFTSEKRSYVIPSSDVIDLGTPKSVTDFVQEKVYSVRWDVLKREDSETTEDTYGGTIQLLGTSPESLIAQAKKSSPPIRLPKEFLAEFQPKSQKATKSEDKKAVKHSQTSSRRERKASSVATSTSSKGTMKAIATQQPIVVGSNETITVNSQSVAKDSNVGSTPVDTSRSDKKRSSGGGLPGSKRIRRNDKNVEESDSDSGASTVCTCNNNALTETIRKQEEQISSLKQQLASEKKKLSAAETDLNSMRLRLEAWKKAHEHLVEVAKTDAATPKPFELKEQKSETPNTPNDGAKKLLNFDPNTPNDGAKKLLNFDDEEFCDPDPDLSRSCDTAVSPQSEGKESDTSSSIIESKVDAAASEPFKGTAPDTPASTVKKCDTAAPEPSKDTAPDTPTSTHKKCDNDGLKVPKVNKPKKETTDGNKKGNMKYSCVGALGPDERPNKDLAPMILRALKGEEALQANADGKFLIGNNVYIKKAVWEKICSPKCPKLSIAIKDLTEEVFGPDGCAKYSLCGGKSPKSEVQKEAAPAGKVEAIFGVFRAKKMLEGLTSELHLDQAIANEAERYIREKFQHINKRQKKNNAAAPAAPAAE